MTNLSSFLDVSHLVTALISGLVGSLAGAGLNFLVQNAIAKRRRTEDESRLAYVYLVKVSQIVAGGEVIKEVVTKMFGPTFAQMMDGLKTRLPLSGEDYATEHAMFVIVSRAIESIRKDNGRKGVDQAFSAIQRAGDDMLEEFTIPPNVMAGLPQHAVISYELLTGAIRSVKTTATRLSSYAESGDEDLISPKVIYAGWQAMLSMRENAAALREALIEKGHVEPERAKKMLFRLKKHIALQTWTGLVEGFKLDAAAKVLNDKVDELIRENEERAVTELKRAAHPVDEKETVGFSPSADPA